MKKEIFMLGLFIALVLLIVPFAQASIIISGPATVYNLGDDLSINVKTSYGQDLDAFLRVLLVCGSDENLMYFSPIQLVKDREKSISIDWSVDEALGSCHVSAVLESKENKIEEAQSSEFELSDKIELNISLDKQDFKPSEKLKLSGKATKANGQAFDGAIIIIFDEKEYPVSASKGSFSFSTQLASNIESGLHNMVINAKDNYGNLGSADLNFEVAAIPTSLVIELSNESLLPSELLVILPKLLDQAQGIIDASIHVRLNVPKTGLLGEESILMEELIASGNSTFYRFARDAAPGSYLIKAEAAGFETEQYVTVLILEKANFSIENETLYVTNIGNAPYQKALEIRFKIENQTTKKVIELDLEVGETQVFELSAPKGNYEIEILAENETTSFSDVPLTGGVVTVLELKPKTTVNKNFWLFIIVLIVIVIIVLLLYFAKKQKHKYGKPKKPAKLKSDTKKITVETVPKTDSEVKAAFKKHAKAKDLVASTLIPSLVYGTKQELTALNVSIPDIEKNKTKDKIMKAQQMKILEDFFSAAMEKIKARQGVADLHGNNLVVMFNIIKQYRHDVAAIRTAQEIRNIASGLNLKIKAGINTGLAMVSSIKPDKTVKYTQMANSITLAQQLAGKAKDNEILLSDTIHRRVHSVVKTRKVSPYYLNDKEAIEVYALEDASPKEIRDKHKWFIDRALGRK